MKKQSLHFSNAKVSDISFDDLFDESDWRQKAARLQARRWRMIKRQMV